jgi:hypothetical protein
MLTFASDSATNLHIDNGILRQRRSKSKESADARRAHLRPGGTDGRLWGLNRNAPAQFRSRSAPGPAKSDHSFTATACPGSGLDMATVDVSVTSDLSPEKAWELASDLSRFDEWLTIFGGWKSPVPDEVEVGTSVSSAIKVKGFRNVIHWRVTRYDEPKAIELVGRGKPAVCIALRMCVQEAPGRSNTGGSRASGDVASGSSADVASGSVFQVIADLTGGLLNTPVGNLVAKVLESDVRKSVMNLAALR